MLNTTALAVAPRVELLNRKFFLDMTNGFIERSERLLLSVNAYFCCPKPDVFSCPRFALVNGRLS